MEYDKNKSENFKVIFNWMSLLLFPSPRYLDRVGSLRIPLHQKSSLVTISAGLPGLGYIKGISLSQT